MKLKNSRIRFSSVDWFNELREISIGGVGTIGTHLSLSLARSGDHTLILYDNDIVEMENLSGQLFPLSAINENKVEAVKELILTYTEIDPVKVFPVKELIVEGTYVSPVCFSCFDNMKGRKTMFEQWCKLEDREIFIDGRMTIESYEVYTVTKGNEERYRATLFDDSELPDQICSFKNTSHTGALIGARMTVMFTNHLANVKMGIAMRSVPFKFREEMQMNLINIEE
jgi:molybdopterin/thiamine biosynthesis adenylyltransferase